jgi:hypothetical protein
MDGYQLAVQFDDGYKVLYDVMDDMVNVEEFKDLQAIGGLWAMVKLDKSRTVVYWNDRIDLPSDTIYEYGKTVSGFGY